MDELLHILLELFPNDEVSPQRQETHEAHSGLTSKVANIIVAFKDNISPEFEVKLHNNFAWNGNQFVKPFKIAQFQNFIQNEQYQHYLSKKKKDASKISTETEKVIDDFENFRLD